MKWMALYEDWGEGEEWEEERWEEGWGEEWEEE